MKYKFNAFIASVLLFSILSIATTTSVHAVWWKPTTWKIFNKQKTILIQNTTSSTIINTQKQENNKKNEKSSSITKTKPQEPSSPAQTPPTQVVQKKEAPVETQNQFISAFSEKKKLIIQNSTGGTIQGGDKISCYSNERCEYSFPSGTILNLRAIPNAGYILKTWSEASCGNSLDCRIKLNEDMTVYAYFEVVRPEKKTGIILSPEEGDTCYIPMGEDKCQAALIWKSNTGLDMTVKADYDEYYVTTKDDNMLPRLSEADPVDISKAKEGDASGLIYFPFFAGDHKLTILHRTEVLDSVNFNVECATGLYWDGRKCWEKNAKVLFIFKDQHAVIESEPVGIMCGYRPERCMIGFSNGTRVTLKATVDSNYIFDGWTGACSGKELTCTIVMDSEKSVGIKLK